jgi:hypothetical protein
MTGPKTHTTPPVGTCCAIDCVTWIDIEDGVPNQGLFGGGGGGFGEEPADELTEFWSSGWPPIAYAIHGQRVIADYHSFTENYVRPPFDLHAMGVRGGVTVYDPPIVWNHGPKEIYDMVGARYDYVFICHSQGCNIAMRALHRICN